MAAAGAIELETSWREMRSAKRKASKYKTGMLEAQARIGSTWPAIDSTNSKRVPRLSQLYQK